MAQSRHRRWCCCQDPVCTLHDAATRFLPQKARTRAFRLSASRSRMSWILPVPTLLFAGLAALLLALLLCCPVSGPRLAGEAFVVTQAVIALVRLGAHGGDDRPGRDGLSVTSRPLHGNPRKKSLICGRRRAVAAPTIGGPGQERTGVTKE